MLTRVSIAFDDDWNVASPTWTRLDVDYKVERAGSDRGRTFEFDKYEAGTATIRLRDHNGDFDPNYELGAFYGKCDPRKQAKIELQNPVTDAVSTIFRGFVTRWKYVPVPTEKWNYVDIDLVDARAIIAQAEILADGNFGDDVVDGNIVYAEDSSLEAVRNLIVKVLDEVAFPGTGNYADVLRDINTGNVGLFRKPYPPRTSALTVIEEACEADFPIVSGGFFITKLGEARFMGRYTRLNPSNPDYGIQTWKVGDDTAADAAPSQLAPLAPPLQYDRDETHIYNVATCAPMLIDDADIPGQVVIDTSSRGQYGPKNWSAEGLRTRNGDASRTALEETQLIAQFVVDNYKQPQTRVSTLTVLSRMTDHPNAGRVWALFCGVELNDIIEMTQTMEWGGGFVEHQFFVERISYEITPMNDQIDRVVLKLDVSPAEYAGTNTFGET